MANLPADIINQALDAAGVDLVIGDPEEGTREAQVCLRAYRECLRQLLRGCHWDFARKTAPLTLLADASGQTANVGTSVPVPWLYEYSYPQDCLKARFVPQNFNSSYGIPSTNIQLPSVAQTTGIYSPNLIRVVPARFVVATDYNNIPNVTSIPLWWEQYGVSPIGQTVILTNVANAQLVYTAFVPYPNLWDAQFRAAFVAYLASEVALPLAKDKKFGLSIRAQQVAIAREKVQAARVTNGNEGTSSVDHTPDWIRIRSAGMGRWGAEGLQGGPGYLWGNWDSIGFSDGSTY